MKNNRDSFRPGKKPFSRDDGYKTNKSGDFKRNDRGDRNFSRNKSGDFNKKDDYRDRSKSNYSPYSSNYSNNNSRNNSDGGYNKFKKSDNFNRFDKSEKSDKPNRFSNFDKDKSDNFKKFDRKFTPNNNDKKPPFKKFDKFEKSDSFKKFDRSPDKKWERKPMRDSAPRSPRPAFDKKFNKVEPDVNVIVSSVEQEDSGMVYGRNAVIELLKSDKSIDKLFVQSGQKEGSITMIFAEAVKKSTFNSLTLRGRCPMA